MHETNGFAPPGPGVWELEATHLQRPVSRALAAVFPAAATEGFREGMARYGMLLECMEFAVVNRFVYMCARPVGAPPDAKAPPPKFIFKLLTKVHPEIRRRVRRVTEVWETKFWREDVKRWDEEWKPAIARENGELQRVDLRALNGEQLIAHVERCFDAVRRAVTMHHNLNSTAMLPTGDFLVHVREWTGLSPADVLPLFRGSSRVSQGATDELQALGRALNAHADAQLLLAGSDPAAVIDALVARTDAVGEAARRYVDETGVRILSGYDIADLTGAEVPGLLVQNIRAAMTRPDSAGHGDVKEREAALRDKVPAQHRQRFDELLGEARLTYRIRDERTYLNDMWSAGLTRRAILEAGRRLHANGKLHDAGHAVELTPAELVSMLRSGSDRTADQAAADATFRTTHTSDDAPPFLGGTPSAPPPVDWFPPAAARAERAVRMVMGEMFASRDKQKATSKVNGFAASPGDVVGIARLVLQPGDMARVQKGDILITRATTPSYNALLPLLSGIVTDRGGTLSHAALVAREYGIPAVVGTGNATELIRDGVRVRIDGANGTVQVLA
ncbi:MAG: rifampicin phosphotransferase [Acidobacteriota bacterium]|nr:rifampicin phosphotransferase [Acidobacteriota bacterium]